MSDLPDVCGGIEQKLSNGIEPSAKNGTSVGLCSLAHLEKRFSKGELIFGPYEAEKRIFIVRTGQIEIFQLSPEGKKVIIDLLTPGNIFSNSPFSANPDVESHDFALARSKVVLCILQKSDFMEALYTRPRLAVSLIQEFSTKLSEADDRIRDLALSNIRIRLVSELIRLGRKFGIEFGGKIMLRIKFTHEELAAMTGATRETVTRVLAKLRQADVVSLNKSRNYVIDKEKAKEILGNS